MEIDEKRLRELVIKAIELFQSENSKREIAISKKKLYVVFTEDWNSKYWRFFEEINKQNQYEVNAVIPKKIKNTLYLNNLKKFEVCQNIINEEDINFDEFKEYITVFPVIPRNIVVKTALCIDDTFETKWIFKSMEKGQRIIILKSGLEKFTGKEPNSYINRILNYYRTLLEFNINISEDITESNDNLFASQNNLNYDVSFKENEKQNGKQIITSNEIEKYQYEKKIILHKGDIITDAALEKAISLKIEVIR